mmetsp:Transcript_15803/g.36589  ORF Transcript_15803/g.36589 Transcript_15803/m.36589 type:complete len:254 (-) Transcript_15803:169-930(-)
MQVHGGFLAHLHRRSLSRPPLGFRQVRFCRQLVYVVLVGHVGVVLLLDVFLEELFPVELVRDADLVGHVDQIVEVGPTRRLLEVLARLGGLVLEILQELNSCLWGVLLVPSYVAGACAHAGRSCVLAAILVVGAVIAVRLEVEGSAALVILRRREVQTGRPPREKGLAESLVAETAPRSTGGLAEVSHESLRSRCRATSRRQMLGAVAVVVVIPEGSLSSVRRRRRSRSIRGSTHGLRFLLFCLCWSTVARCR